MWGMYIWEEDMNKEIHIYSSKKEKNLTHFWSGMVFHPTDAIEDDWGQRILDRISVDKAVRCVRIYAMLEDIVTVGQDGKLRYDFTLNDLRLDYLLSKGFDIMLSYAFIPPWLAADTHKTSSVAKGKTRYKGKVIVASYPGDYDRWEEICRNYTEHIVERYGEEIVAGWRLQCYNEPNLEWFFMNGEKDVKRRCQEYCRLYDGFEAGVTAVSSKLKIGGPALAEEEGYCQFLKQFLRYAAEENKKLDFISFHTYGTTPEELNDGSKPLNIRNSLETINNIMEAVRQEGFGHLPVICDEWGAASAGFYNMEECPALWFRETEVFSAYFVKLLTLYDELKLPLEKMMICLSGQHEMTEDFSGFRNFFTLHFYPKPIYNAHVLSARLGEYKLCCEGEKPEHVSVMPTLHEDGHISILLGYADDKFERELAEIKLTLVMDDIAGSYDVKLYRIDGKHSNAYYRYCLLGKPSHPTRRQQEEIQEAARCRPEDWGIISPEDTKITFTMTNNSVTLVELLRK